MGRTSNNSRGILYSEVYWKKALIKCPSFCYHTFSSTRDTKGTIKRTCCFRAVNVRIVRISATWLWKTIVSWLTQCFSSWSGSTINQGFQRPIVLWRFTLNRLHYSRESCEREIDWWNENIMPRKHSIIEVVVVTLTLKKSRQMFWNIHIISSTTSNNWTMSSNSQGSLMFQKGKLLDKSSKRTVIH